MYHKAWNGTKWEPGRTEWENLGGALGSAPAVASWGSQRLDIFVNGPGGRMYHKAWDGSAWQPGHDPWGWEDLGGALAGTPAVTSWSRFSFTPPTPLPPGPGAQPPAQRQPPPPPLPSCNTAFVGFIGQGIVEMRVYGGGFMGGAAPESIEIDQDGSFATTTTADSLGSYSVVLSVFQGFPPRNVTFKAIGLVSGRNSNIAGFWI